MPRILWKIIPVLAAKEFKWGQWHSNIYSLKCFGTFIFWASVCCKHYSPWRSGRGREQKPKIPLGIRSRMGNRVQFLSNPYSSSKGLIRGMFISSSLYKEATTHIMEWVHRKMTALVPLPSEIRRVTTHKRVFLAGYWNYGTLSPGICTCSFCYCLLQVDDFFFVSSGIPSAIPSSSPCLCAFNRYYTFVMNYFMMFL